MIWVEYQFTSPSRLAAAINAASAAQAEAAAIEKQNANAALDRRAMVISRSRQACCLPIALRGKGIRFNSRSRRGPSAKALHGPADVRHDAAPGRPPNS